MCPVTQLSLLALVCAIFVVSAGGVENGQRKRQQRRLRKQQQQQQQQQLTSSASYSFSLPPPPDEVWSNDELPSSAGGEQVEGGDLGHRFSKFEFRNFPEGDSYLPMTPSNYPIQGDLASMLRNHSTAISVIVEDDFPLIGVDLDRFVDAAGNRPTHPNANPNHAFWRDFRAVVQAQLHRRANGDPSQIMPLPVLWQNFTIDQVAQAVRAEYPGYWQSLLLEQLFSEGVEIDYDILPFMSEFDFIGGPVRMAALNTWVISKVAPCNFRAKWRYGRSRPEEVAFMISDGRISRGVPADIFKDIRSMNLSSAVEFTAYPEGAPRHPSWPAMHSAASTSSMWMPIVFNMTQEQYCQTVLTDYAVAYGRTVAGVHYPTDNFAGLNMGQEVIASTLAQELADSYGSDAAKVQAKIDSLRFDWNTFDPSSCAP